MAVVVVCVRVVGSHALPLLSRGELPELALVSEELVIVTELVFLLINCSYWLLGIFPKL